MQWGHIKTLFIICFLVLDIFLINEMLEKRAASEELSALEETFTREDTLRANFDGLEDLPEEEQTASYLRLRPKRFSNENLSVFEPVDNQTISLASNQTMLVSKLKEPVPIDLSKGSEEIESAVKGSALLATDYTYWASNEETNTLLFFQEHGNKPIYYSQSGLLLVFLNDQNEMVQYIQTEMDLVDELEKKDLINAIDAVSYLYFVADELLSGDDISGANLGYHTLTPLPDSMQVFVPSWNITINNSRNYLVNAVEGGSTLRDDMSFLRETFSSYRSGIIETEKNNDVLEEARNRIEAALNTTTWSEENDD